MVLNLILVMVIGLVLNALVIWIVSQLGLGLRVRSFGSAIVAAAVIAIISAIVGAILGALGMNMGGGFWGAVVNLIVAAVVLMISGSLLGGMEVEGFLGALIAALAMGGVSWLVQWLLSLLGLV